MAVEAQNTLGQAAAPAHTAHPTDISGLHVSLTALQQCSELADPTLLEMSSKCTDDDQAKQICAQRIRWCRSVTLQGLIVCQPSIRLEDILILARSQDLSASRVAAMETALKKVPCLTTTREDAAHQNGISGCPAE